MLIWHLDRLARSATWCLIAAVALCVAVAFATDAAAADVENELGGLLVGALIVGTGGVVGSVVTSGAGVVLMMVIAVLVQPNAPMLAAIGAAGFVALLLVDLSISLRRAPLVDRSLWRDLAVSVLVVLAPAWALFAIAWFVATRATWQAALVPLGVIAIGYAMRLAADAHHRRVQP